MARIIESYQRLINAEEVLNRASPEQAKQQEIQFKRVQADFSLSIRSVILEDRGYARRSSAVLAKICNIRSHPAKYTDKWGIKGKLVQRGTERWEDIWHPDIPERGFTVGLAFDKRKVHINIGPEQTAAEVVRETIEALGEDAPKGVDPESSLLLIAGMVIQGYEGENPPPFGFPVITSIRHSGPLSDLGIREGSFLVLDCSYGRC